MGQPRTSCEATQASFLHLQHDSSFQIWDAPPHVTGMSLRTLGSFRKWRRIWAHRQLVTYTTLLQIEAYLQYPIRKFSTVWVNSCWLMSLGDTFLCTATSECSCQLHFWSWLCFPHGMFLIWRLMILFISVVIEFLPAELKSRFVQMKELDEHVQSMLVSLYTSNLSYIHVCIHKRNLLLKFNQTLPSWSSLSPSILNAIIVNI